MLLPVQDKYALKLVFEKEQVDLILLDIMMRINAQGLDCMPSDSNNPARWTYNPSDPFSRDVRASKTVLRKKRV